MKLKRAISAGDSCVQRAVRGVPCAVLLSLVGCGAPPTTGVDDEGGSLATNAEAQVQQAPQAQQQPQQIPPICWTCPPTLVSGATPTGLAVTSSTVFWTGAKSTSSGFESGIYSVPISGGSPTLFHASDQYGQTPNSVVAAGSSLYWQQPGSSGGTWTMPQAGGTATKLGPLPNLYAAQRQAVAARVTTSVIHLPPFTLTITSNAVVAGEPDNSHLSKFTSSTLSPAWTTTTLLDYSAIDYTGPQTGLYYPDSVTLDASNVYFVAYRYFSLPNAVYQMSLSGGAPITIGMADIGSPLAVYGTNVYFVSGNSVVTVPIGGGTQSTFVTDSGPPTTFAVDGSTLYWTCSSCGTVSKHSFTGGATTTVATGQTAAKFLAVDATNVYWGVTGAIRYHAK